MKKQFFLVALLVVFALILAHKEAKAQSGEELSVYSTVSYDDVSNNVNGYSYTYATYGHSGYYSTEVSSYLVDSDYNLIASDTGSGNLQTTILLFGSGRGCDEYTILSSHQVVRQYYVTAFYYNGSFWDGYYSPFDYLLAEGQSEPFPNSFTVPAIEEVTIFDVAEFFLGSTSATSSGNCVIPQIQILEFEEIGGYLDPHPAINGLNSSNAGKRIYSDKDHPTTDSIDRTKVRVKATVTPATQGVTIHFANFDMDDPSTNTAPLDTTGAAGNDNNGTVNGNLAGQLSSTSATTNSSGVASVELTVTKQPGDNFAIVATKDNANYLSGISTNGLNLMKNGSAIPTTQTTSASRLIRTELLTVWRRLNIEVDSMGIVSGNSVTGMFSSNQTIAATGNTTLQVSSSLSPDRFENGRLVVGTTSFTVVDHTATSPSAGNTTVNVANTANTVTVTNTTGMPFAVTSGQSFTLYDDDDFNNDDGTTFDGDAGNENVGTPDLGILQPFDTPCTNVYTTNNCNVLADAYVMPSYNLVGTGEDIPFQLHVDGTGLNTIYNNANYFDNRGSHANADFWTIYALGAYQYTEDKDSDPDEFGATYGVANAAGVNAQGFAIFIELNRTREFADLDRWGTTPSWQLRPVANRFTTAHELGHLFGGDHNDNVSGNAGIMRQSVDRTQAVFNIVTLNKIRGGTGITYP